MKAITVEISDDLFRKIVHEIDETGITNINTAINLIISRALEDYLKDKDD